MVRMIASDIDGTLVKPGQEELPEEVHDLIRALDARGIAFCVASGRQFSNLYTLFGRSAGKVYYVCENGALVFDRGVPDRPIEKLTIPPEMIRELAGAIWARPECEILFSGLDTSYLMLKTPESLPKVQSYLGGQIIQIGSVEEIRDEIVQISAYCEPDTRSVYEKVAHLRSGLINVVVAGEHWIDFTCASKGVGLERLCAETGIAPAEVMAFGDNFNDVPMLDLAGAPVVMENAPPAVRDRYPDRCGNVVSYLNACLAAGTL